MAIVTGPVRMRRVVRALHKDRGHPESDVRQAIRDLIDAGFLGITLDWKLAPMKRPASLR